MPEALDLDEPDRRLLNELQADCSRSVAQLAEAVGLSASACYRRIQRLRESGVILREAAIVDPRKSPWPFVVIVEVTLERINEPLRRAFETRIRGIPQIMQCYSVSGQTDFLMIVALAGMEDYYAFVHDVLVSDENIKHFNSTFAIHTLKSKTSIDF